MNLLLNSPTDQQRVGRTILTQIGSVSLAFSAATVAEIMQIERGQILTLPFYHASVLGLIHYKGAMVPMVSLALLYGISDSVTKASLYGIRLNGLASVGWVVDRILGSFPAEQVEAQAGSSRVVFFEDQTIPADLWRPLLGVAEVKAS